MMLATSNLYPVSRQTPFSMLLLGLNPGLSLIGLEPGLIVSVIAATSRASA